MSDLRRRTIRLAASFPQGSTERQALLAVLKSADDADLGWATMLKTKKYVEDELMPAENYTRQVALVKALRAGDKVEVTYTDNQRGGAVKTVRVVTHSWSDLQEGSSGYSRPTVLLAQKGVQRPGQVKGGMIADYGPDSGVVWQPSLHMAVRGVTDLRRV